MPVSSNKPLTLKQQRFVDALPTASSQAEAARIAGYAPGPNAWNQGSLTIRNHEVQQALADRKKALSARVAQAQTHFYENVESIAKVMVERAQGTGRDSQRAGERILEEVGVLHREPLVVIEEPSREMLDQLSHLVALARGRDVAVEPPAIEGEVAEARIERATGLKAT